MATALRQPALSLLLAAGSLAGLVPAAAQPPVVETTVVRVVSAAASGEEIRYSMGSGFFVNDIHIVTNEHLVSRPGSAPELFVLFAGQDTPEAVELAWSSPDLDLAVLRYGGDTPHAALALANPDPARGAEVFALGYPGPADTGSLGGAVSSTLTEGIQSRAPFEARWGSTGTAAVRVLQHTAAINPGSSGGPLVNALWRGRRREHERRLQRASGCRRQPRRDTRRPGHLLRPGGLGTPRGTPAARSGVLTR